MKLATEYDSTNCMECIAFCSKFDENGFIKYTESCVNKCECPGVFAQ